MHFLKRRYWLKKPTTSFGIPKFVLASMIIFLGLNIVLSSRADASEPATPARPDLATSSDSGSSSSDDLTNDNTPTINVSGPFTGTRTVTAIQAGSSVSCTLSSGAYTCGTLADGVWSISVTDTDSAGNSATSETLSITVDTTAPSTPTITAQTVSDKENISIQVADSGIAFLNYWTANSNAPTSATSITSTQTQFWNSVEVVANTQALISTLDLGTGYNYKLYVVDQAGNISSGSTNLVKVNPASRPTISGPTRPSSSSPADKVGSTLTNVMSVSGLPVPTISYQYVRCPSVSGDWEPTCVNIPGATSTTYILSADDAGQYIGIRITATNSEGTTVGLGVATAQVTAAVPGAPTNITATITGSTTATVSFTAPASNGGSSITGYTVTSTPSGAVCAVGGNSTTYNCTGLTANTAYTFTVKATNAAGTGSDSVASSSQTTEANPTIAVALEGSLTVVPITVPVRITATTSKPGTVTFTQDGTNLNQCVNVQTSGSGSNHTATCTWTPALNVSGHGGVRSIVATLTPTSSNYQSVNASKSISVTNIGGVNFPAPSITNVVVSGNSATVYFNVGSPSLGPIGYSISSSWINFQYSLDGGTSWNETGTYYYLTSNGNWVNFNAAPSPLVISGLSAQTYNFQIRQQIYHAPGSYPNTYWLVAPSVAAPNTGGGSQAYSFSVVPLSTTTSVATKSLTADTAATSFTPITASGGGSSKIYSISPSLPSGLTLNTSTGAITGTPTGASASTSYTVSVTDGSSTSTATFSLGVNAALSSSTGTVPSGVYKDVAVTAFTPISFSGGTSPISYAVSPSLPAGLTLNTSTGVISGTATGTAANTTYTVTATDANGDTEASTFAFAVTDAPTAPGAPTIGAATSTGQTTATVAFTAPANTGGAAITTYTVTASPGGITATGSSSPITVTGLTAGTAYTFTVTARNNLANSVNSLPSTAVTTAAAPPPAAGPTAAEIAQAQNEVINRAAAARAIAEKLIADKAAADAAVKAAEEKAAADLAAKVLADKAAADAAARAAADRAAAEAAIKAVFDRMVAAQNAQMAAAQAAQAAAVKINAANSAKAAAQRAAIRAEALTKSPTVSPEDKQNAAAAAAAAEVKAVEAVNKAAIAAATKVATKSVAVTATKEVTISIGSLNSIQSTARSSSMASATASAAQSAANAAVKSATSQASTAKNAAENAAKAAADATARAELQQKIANEALILAKEQQKALAKAAAEKAAAEKAAQAAATALAAVLEEQAAAEERMKKATTEAEIQLIDKLLNEVDKKVESAKEVLVSANEVMDDSEELTAELEETLDQSTVILEKQVKAADIANKLVEKKITAAEVATQASVIAKKTAVAASKAAKSLPRKIAKEIKAPAVVGRSNAVINIGGLKPGQKIRVSVKVNIK